MSRFYVPCAQFNLTQTFDKPNANQPDFWTNPYGLRAKHSFLALHEWIWGMKSNDWIGYNRWTFKLCQKKPKPRPKQLIFLANCYYYYPLKVIN